MKKNLNLDKVDAFMKNTREAGIMVHGCFMVGNLNEDKETLDAFMKALDQLDKARIDEGKEIYKDFQKRLKKIKIDIISIEKLPKKLTLKRKSEIAEKIKSLTQLESLDENRLMQEVAYLIERSDITEETVRVNIHIDSFLKYLESPFLV